MTIIIKLIYWHENHPPQLVNKVEENYHDQGILTQPWMFISWLFSGVSCACVHPSTSACFPGSQKTFFCCICSNEINKMSMVIFLQISWSSRMKIIHKGRYIGSLGPGTHIVPQLLQLTHRKSIKQLFTLCTILFKCRWIIHNYYLQTIFYTCREALIYWRLKLSPPSNQHVAMETRSSIG